MYPLTISLPKPLLPNPETSLLLNQINFLRNHVENLFVTVGYMSGLVGKSAVKFGADHIIDIGAGGNASWIQASNLTSIDSQMIVITCDNVMDVDLSELSREVSIASSQSFIVPIEKDYTYRGDRLEVEGDKIKDMGPTKNSKLLASGLQVITPKELSSNGRKYEDFSEVWKYLIESRSLFLTQTRPTTWLAVDTPKDLEFWISNRGNSN